MGYERHNNGNENDSSHEITNLKIKSNKKYENINMPLIQNTKPYKKALQIQLQICRNTKKHT